MEAAGGEEEVTELWYQLPAEADASSFFPTLSETGVRGEQTDFPSMEEGSIQSESHLQKRTPGGPTLPLQLDFQDSRLSPCLPLLTSGSVPGQFFEDTLFQQTETEFAPLRASLDMSAFPGSGSQSLQLTDAVKLASQEVLMVPEEDTLSSSPLYEEKSPDGDIDSSSVQYLSEHPLNVSHGGKDEDTITENVPSDVGVSKETGQACVEDLTAEDGAFLGNNVPAPMLLELLEKEVGMSSGSGSSSRRSSQTVSVSGTENMDVPSQEPREDKVNILEPQGQTKTTTGQLTLGEETFRDSSEILFDDPELEKVSLGVPGRLDQSGITLRQPNRQSSPGVRDELQKQLCAEIQREGKRREMAELQKSRLDSSSSSQSRSGLPENMAKPSYSGEDTTEEQPRSELTMSSHCSIERGHKETDMSQAVNTPIDETSFWRLPYPISQSTPGTFFVNRKQLSGRIQEIKAKLTGSDMSLNEEPHSSSSNPNEAASGVQQSAQSSQAYPESSDSQRSLSPPRRKIQSLPSLNYIEKVGSWNTNQSFDSLVLRGLTGVSPKKLAYKAVADSLNRMLSKQSSSSTSKKGAGASFKGTSSMINLNVEHQESSSASRLTRSQSYNSVITAVGRKHNVETTEANVDPVAEEGDTAAKSNTIQSFKALGTQSLLSQDVSEETKYLNVESSMGKNDTAHYVEPIEKSSHKQERGQDESSKNRVTMEHFSDVSLDPEFSGSSHTSDNIRDVLQDSVGSSVLEMSHRQGEPSMQEWSGEAATPENEFNIEERIPTYLRNLGIDQSPTTILKPFGPRGPIREPEFSPTELRTIKSSTATPNRSMRLSEGESQANISQSSLYSTASTASVSIPMGSEVGLGSPLPTEQSPPISQDDTAERGIGGDQEVFSVQALDVEVSPDDRALNDLGSTDVDNSAEDSTHVKHLIGHFRSAGSDARQDNLEQPNLGSRSSSQKKPHYMDSTNDSFVGSKTLKEIRKLLAEADDVHLDLNPKSPLRGPSITSPSPSQTFQDSLKSGASNSRSASPLALQFNNLSWDASFNSENLLNDGSSKVDLHWKDGIPARGPPTDGFYLKDVSKVGLHTPAPLSLHQHGRSEPEGSSEATANRTAPASVHHQDSHVRRAGDSRGVGLRSERLLSSVTRAVGGLQQVLDVTGSSNPRSTGEESDASSGDSLAARVRGLLKSNTSSYTSQVRQATEDENQRGRGSMKLKLAGQPIPTDDDLNEEDRRRIEEIKRELLDGVKGVEKSYRNSNFEPGPTRGSDHFRLQLTPSPHLDQYHNTGSQDSAENSLVSPATSTSNGGSDVGNIKAVATVISHSDQSTSSQLHESLITDLHTPVSDRPASDVDRKTKYSIKSREEAAKPIASITFSSRKRSSPPLTSTGYEPDERHFEYAKSHADPYNYQDQMLVDPHEKGQQQSNKYEKDKQRSDQYERDLHRFDPYVKDKQRPDPPEKDKQRPDPPEKDQQRFDPHERDQQCSDPHERDQQCSDPFKKEQQRFDKYGKDKQHRDQYEKDKQHPDQYGKDEQRPDQYGKDKERPDQYGKDKRRPDQYEKDKRRPDQYEKDKRCPDQYEKDKRRPDQYEKDKPLDDPYYKENIFTGPYYKEKTLPEHLYKGSQPSETTRSNFTYHPSSMDNMIPLNSSISDLTDKGGVLGQSEVIKRHVQPDLTSVVDRISPTYEDTFTARPSKPASLQENIAGRSHSALTTRSVVMSELPHLISDVSVKDWKFYPEPVNTEKMQREETYGFPSQDLKTEPTTITSPTRKALSCIRVTISPKEDLAVSSVTMATGAGNDVQTFGSTSGLSKQVLTSHGLSSAPPSSPYFLHSPPRASHGEVRTNSADNAQMEDKENIPGKAATKEQRRLPLFDATTQITTEGPEKTTFSAEIYIDGSLKEASSSTIVQNPKTPERQLGVPLSSLSRATDQPLLLPYRPPGSPELFYIPVMDGGSRMSPVSTIESSHPGSNDAISPKFPAAVLGSAAEKVSDSSIPRHKDGVYSKEQSPKIAWEEKRKTPGTESSYCSPQQRVPHPEAPSKEFRREKRDLRPLRDDEFFLLKPEVDYAEESQPSRGLAKRRDDHDHGSKISDYPRRREEREQTNLRSPTESFHKLGATGKHVRYEDHGMSGGHSPSSTKSARRTESMLSQSAVSNQSLDDLWARYTERRKSHVSESGGKLETSLVERLDRLARLLKKPTPHSLLASKDEKDGGTASRSDREKNAESKREEREKWYLKKFGVDARLLNGTSEPQDGSTSRSSEATSSEKVLSGGSLYSDFSSEVRSGATEESAGGSEPATQTDGASTYGTNSTISTIDTIRLINAFGPERVRPSSRLSRLYSTIDLQKKRSEETSKKASRSSSNRGHPTKDLHKSLHKTADTDSVSSGSSWEATPVMRNKNGSKVLNKGIQAGDLEIVTSATKRRTRDVGTTFPSPGGEMLKPSVGRAYDDSGVGGPKTRQYIPPGLSWFVPADDAKRDAPKENKLSGPGPAWYESVTNVKPWREPLRERNQQTPATRRGEDPINGSETSKEKPVRPYVRASLQELLKAHRPDFIFQSGERVKRLQLLAKERKLQSVYQSEREAIFNQPERRGGPTYQASYKETSQRMKSIPRREMVQRSKRLYEQLPEIRRRKEEETRRLEYETYRLKAQLFRKKVTNHILGRKTPWN